MGSHLIVDFQTIMSLRRALYVAGPSARSHTSVFLAHRALQIHGGRSPRPRPQQFATSSSTGRIYGARFMYNGIGCRSGPYRFSCEDQVCRRTQIWIALLARHGTYVYSKLHASGRMSLTRFYSGPEDIQRYPLVSHPKLIREGRCSTALRITSVERV